MQSVFLSVCLSFHYLTVRSNPGHWDLWDHGPLSSYEWSEAEIRKGVSAWKFFLRILGKNLEPLGNQNLERWERTAALLINVLFIFFNFHYPPHVRTNGSFYSLNE